METAARYCESGTASEDTGEVASMLVRFWLSTYFQRCGIAQVHAIYPRGRRATLSEADRTAVGVVSEEKMLEVFIKMEGKMGKANILSKNMYAMAEDGNSNSRPSLIAVDRAEMMRHLDELETAMNQTLQDMRSLVEESKRIPLTNTVMIDPTELMYLWAELNKVSLERIFINRKKEDRMKAQEELAELLENYKKWIETYQWNTREKSFETLSGILDSRI